MTHRHLIPSLLISPSFTPFLAPRHLSYHLICAHYLSTGDTSGLHHQPAVGHHHRSGPHTRRSVPPHHHRQALAHREHSLPPLQRHQVQHLWVASHALCAMCRTILWHAAVCRDILLFSYSLLAGSILTLPLLMCAHFISLCNTSSPADEVRSSPVNTLYCYTAAATTHFVIFLSHNGHLYCHSMSPNIL